MFQFLFCYAMISEGINSFQRKCVDGIRPYQCFYVFYIAERWVFSAGASPQNLLNFSAFLFQLTETITEKYLFVNTISFFCRINGYFSNQFIKLFFFQNRINHYINSAKEKAGN